MIFETVKRARQIFFWFKNYLKEYLTIFIYQIYYSKPIGKVFYMISKKTKYAIQALIFLASENAKGPVLISTIAKAERIPKKFLESILLELKNKGFLMSKKGKGGGYALGKHPDKIILGHVIRIFEGPLAPVSCVSQTAYQRCEECKDEKHCGIRLVMKDVRDAIANILDRTTLEDMLQRVHLIKNKGISDFTI